MKNIVWLKEEIGELPYVDAIFDNYGSSYIHSAVPVKAVYELIDQLDEPETLSQELPVIPKFVADWIEVMKPYTSLRVAFEYIAQRKRDNHDDELAFWVEEGNSETFARAWLDGYIIANEKEEEEPLYRARLKVATYKGVAAYLRTQSSDAEERLKALEIGRKYTHEDYRHLSEFTEEELKRLNIWDSDQWEIEGDENE